MIIYRKFGGTGATERRARRRSASQDWDLLSDKFEQRETGPTYTKDRLTVNAGSPGEGNRANSLNVEFALVNDVLPEAPSLVNELTVNSEGDTCDIYYQQRSCCSV